MRKSGITADTDDSTCPDSPDFEHTRRRGFDKNDIKFEFDDAVLSY